MGSQLLSMKPSHWSKLKTCKGCPLAQLSLSELRHHSLSLYGWPLPENDWLHWGCLFSPTLMFNHIIHIILGILPCPMCVKKNLSPLSKTLNCLAMIQANVAPTIPPSTGSSEMPPVKRSMSSTFV